MESVQRINDIIIHNEDTLFPGKDDIIEFYWKNHPRFQFFKTRPRNSTFLDIGAGSGALIFWQQWQDPDRSDLVMTANDLKKGEYFDKYDRYFLNDLCQENMPEYKDHYQSILASHVIEHVNDWHRFLENIDALTNPGGEIYVEWPTVKSQTFPARTQLIELGLPVSTVNFYDDHTHIKTAEIDQIQNILEGLNYSVLQRGVIENEFLGSELIKLGARLNDSETATYGVWTFLGFAQFLVARKRTET